MQHLQRAHTLGVTVAIENLAPVFPGPRRMCHDPLAVRDLVRRLGLAGGRDAARPRAPARHVATSRGPTRVQIARACAGDVVLFHVHDNFGARRRPVDAPGVDPLRLDLHLAPGAGTLPWARVADVAAGHAAPLAARGRSRSTARRSPSCRGRPPRC